MTDTIMTASLGTSASTMTFEWPEGSIILGVLPDPMSAGTSVYLVHQGNQQSSKKEMRTFRVIWNWATVEPNERWIGSVLNTANVPLHVVEVDTDE